VISLRILEELAVAALLLYPLGRWENRSLGPDDDICYEMMSAKPPNLPVFVILGLYPFNLPWGVS
jgi:hypothetical protein